MSMFLSFTMFDQTDRFLRKWYGHYTNREQIEASVLGKYHLAGKQNCKLGRKHCWLCAGRPDMVSLARTRRTSYSQIYLSGKPNAPVPVCYLSTLSLTEITYCRWWMNDWAWATGEMILREGRPKCAERSLSRRHLVHHKSHRAARDQTRVSAGRGLRLTAWAR